MENTFPSNPVQCCPVLTLLPASFSIPLQPATLALLLAPLGHGEGAQTRHEQGQRKGQTGKSWRKLQSWRMRLFAPLAVRRVSIHRTPLCASSSGEPWPAVEGGCTGWLIVLTCCPTSPSLLALSSAKMGAFCWMSLPARAGSSEMLCWRWSKRIIPCGNFKIQFTKNNVVVVLVCTQLLFNLVKEKKQRTCTTWFMTSSMFWHLFHCMYYKNQRPYLFSLKSDFWPKIYSSKVMFWMPFWLNLRILC